MISEAVFCRAARLVATSETAHPCLANSRAMAWPMPLLAPVTMAVRPAKRPIGASVRRLLSLVLSSILMAHESSSETQQFARSKTGTLFTEQWARASIERRNGIVGTDRSD